MSQNTIPTLSFLSYAEFLVELTCQEIGQVRLQAGTRGRPVSGAPGLHLDYILTLTALSANEAGVPQVLACTFRVGGCWAVFRDQHPENQANLDVATELVRADLDQQGITVLPGVYAHETNWGYATPDGLWRFQKDNGKAILALREAGDEQD